MSDISDIEFKDNGSFEELRGSEIMRFNPTSGFIEINLDGRKVTIPASNEEIHKFMQSLIDWRNLRD